MPSPGGACHTCKLRRIKCDEGKPTCQRCSKSGRVCVPTSAANQATFSVHIENSFASGRAKRPRGPRSSFARGPLNLDLETRALAYYMQFHLHITSSGPNAAGVWSECVSEWMNSGRSCQMVDLGLSTLALAVYSRIHRDATAVTEASTRYHRLLQLVQDRIVQAEISSLNESDIDSCLFTILLMSRYEGSIQRPGTYNPRASSESLQSWSHHDGAMAILKLWHDNWRHKGSSSITKATRRGILKSRLLRDIELPDWIHDGQKFGESGLDLDYDRVYVRVIKLHYAAGNLEKHSDPRIVQIEELHSRGHKIDSALKEWIDQFPSTCRYQRLALPGARALPRTHFYSATVFGYASVGDAALWIRYFAMSMLLLNTIWRVLKLLRPDFEWKKQLLKRNERLQEMGDNLASSIPYCLQRIKLSKPDAKNPPDAVINAKKEDMKPYLAGLIVWPLTIASGLEGIDEKQRQWFRSELVELGKITGDGCLECAGTEEWLKL